MRAATDHGLGRLTCGGSDGEPAMNIRSFQRLIEDIYFARDSGRGLAATFTWFVEEVGELARALNRGNRQEQEEEFADVLAWLSTLASIQGVDLEAIARDKYENGCPKCGGTPCACREEVIHNGPQAVDRSMVKTACSGPNAK